MDRSPSLQVGPNQFVFASSSPGSTRDNQTPSTPPPQLSSPSPVSPFTIDRLYSPCRYPPSPASSMQTTSPVTPKDFPLPPANPCMNTRPVKFEVDNSRMIVKTDQPQPHRRLSFGSSLSSAHHPPRSITNVHDSRSPVDPSIKGIPQGWDDDLTIPMAPPSVANSDLLPTLNNMMTFGPGPAASLLQRQPEITSTGSASGAAAVGGSAGVPVTRSGFINNFNNSSPVRPPLVNAASRLREGTTRIKLSSFNAIRSRGSRRTSSIGYGGPPSPPSLSRTPYPSLPDGPSNGSLEDVSSGMAPKSATESINSANDFADLFTGGPNSQLSTTSASSVQGYEASESSVPSLSSKRERVLGIRQDGPLPTHSKVFLPPKISEVLPFASRPYAAWDPDAIGMADVIGGNDNKARRLSVSFGSTTTDSYQSPTCDGPRLGSEGWKTMPRPRGGGGGGGKKLWINESGLPVGGVYKVGWEQQVLDLEARLHETMYDIAGSSHTFTEYEIGKEPKLVLDIGTGIGLWPISQALAWPETKFVGIDLVPCQANLEALAAAERNARSTSCATATGLGIWGSVEKRISFERCNFLDSLPYDTGVFDMVHLRFVGLGVPESKWGDLLDEASRVLKPGGRLEIVETSYMLPTTAPPSLRHSFASLLLSDLIQPLPALAIRLTLPSTPSLISTFKPTFEQKWTDNDVPGALADAATIWVRSALDYKGTGIVNKPGTKRKDIVIVRAKEELNGADDSRWFVDEGQVEIPVVQGEVSVCVWLATKK